MTPLKIPHKFSPPKRDSSLLAYLGKTKPTESQHKKFNLIRIKKQQTQVDLEYEKKRQETKKYRELSMPTKHQNILIAPKIQLKKAKRQTFVNDYKGFGKQKQQHFKNHLHLNVQQKRHKRQVRVTNLLKEKEKEKLKESQKQKKQSVENKQFWVHPNDKLEGYKILGQLGQGGYAYVQLAMSKQQQKYYAVKIYDKLKLPKASKLKSIHRQIEVMNYIKQYDHPFIVKMYQWKQGVSLIYIVLEYCKGGSLWDRQKLSQKQLKPIIKQIVETLLFLDKMGIAHRDIKAENVLFHKGKVKLIDFGFALFCKKSQLINTYCGTPTYMAPEIVSRIPHNPLLSDRWSLGILIYLVLQGDYPFSGDNQQQLFENICQKQLQFPFQISKSCTKLIKGLLQRQPKNRLSYEEVLNHQWLSQ